MKRSAKALSSVFRRLDTGVKEIWHPTWWRLVFVRKDDYQPLKAGVGSERTFRSVRRKRGGRCARERRRARRNAQHRLTGVVKDESLNTYGDRNPQPTGPTDPATALSNELRNLDGDLGPNTGRVWTMPGILYTGADHRVPFRGIDTIGSPASVNVATDSARTDLTVTAKPRIGIPPPASLVHGNTRKRITNPAPRVTPHKPLALLREDSEASVTRAQNFRNAAAKARTEGRTCYSCGRHYMGFACNHGEERRKRK